MDEMEIRGSVLPGGSIDTTRLREIRRELLWYTQWRDIFYHIDDFASTYLPFAAINAISLLSSAAVSQTYANLPPRIMHPLVQWIVARWTAICPNSDAAIVFVLLALLLPYLLQLLRQGCSLLTRRKLQARLQHRLSESGLVSNLLDGWDTLPDINQYLPGWIRKYSVWVPPHTLHNMTVKVQIRSLIQNLNWYALPPKPLVRWQWFHQGIVAVALLLGVIGIYGYFGTHNRTMDVPAPYVWNYYFLMTVISTAIALLSSLIAAIIPGLPPSVKARILLNRLKPVFELLAPERNGH